MADQPSEADIGIVARLLVSELDGLLVSQEAMPGNAPPTMRRAVRRGRRGCADICRQLAPQILQRRGLVLVVQASPWSWTTDVIPAEQVLTVIEHPDSWEDPAEPEAPPGTDPLAHLASRQSLAARFALDGVRGLLALGGTPTRIMDGWALVFGLVAWDGSRVWIHHAAGLVEDAPLH